MYIVLQHHTIIFIPILLPTEKYFTEIQSSLLCSCYACAMCAHCIAASHQFHCPPRNTSQIFNLFILLLLCSCYACTPPGMYTLHTLCFRITPIPLPTKKGFTKIQCVCTTSNGRTLGCSINYHRINSIAHQERVHNKDSILPPQLLLCVCTTSNVRTLY